MHGWFCKLSSKLKNFYVKGISLQQETKERYVLKSRYIKRWACAHAREKSHG